jgi:hypothetical protein
MWTVLEIAIGLGTVFLVFSIVVSGINEWVAQLFARRGEYLRFGLQRLISDGAIYRRVLHHPLVGSLYRERAAQGKPPSYIDPNTFAMAIADVLLARARVSQPQDAAEHPALTIDALRAALRTPALAASPVAFSLGPIIDRAGDDLGAALQGIQTWFNSGMDRVSGWYKTRTRWMLLWIGLLLAALCNVDAIEIAATLNHSPALRESLVNTATGIVESGKVGNVTITDLRGRAPTQEEWQSVRPVLEGMRSASGTLPIGYECLGAAFAAPQTVARLTGDAAAANKEVTKEPAKDTAKDTAAQRTVWTECAKQMKSAVTSGSPANGLLKLVGWLLTAAAGTLGAGYWFGLLTKAINIRGTGPKPDTKPTGDTPPGDRTAGS